MSSSEGMDLAKRLNIPFVETSAKTSANVQQAFLKMASNIKNKVEASHIDGIQVNMLKRKGTVRLADTIGRGRKGSAVGGNLCCPG